MNLFSKLLVGFLGFGTATSVSTADDTKPTAKRTDETIVVPIELLPSRHFVVLAKINGKGPFRFILDTGAPLTIMNNKTAMASELTKKNVGGLLSMLGGGLSPMTISKLEIGSVVADKTTAIVMDHPTVSAISDAFKDDSGPIEGLIGFPFFARYAMTVDYQKKELTFKPNGYKPGDYMDDLTKRLTDLDALSKPRTVSAAGLWGFEVDKENTDETAGVEVKKVYADGPMGQAGLKVGDRLLTLDGRWTDSLGDTATAASLCKPGKAVRLMVFRDGKELELKATPVAGK